MFAFVMSITPGPNNIMLTSSGLMFGFKRSIPHMLGITAGCAVMSALCAVGVGAVFTALPQSETILKSIGSAYLLYLAWKLRRISVADDGVEEGRPMTFHGAAAFQFINPKAWIMAVSGAAGFLPKLQPFGLAVAVFCLVYCSVGLPCISVWAGAGAALRRYLRQRVWRIVFCTTMVVLTVYSAIAMWI
jgi:threonine/homoserine/homoserine lactone efflux protein